MGHVAEGTDAKFHDFMAGLAAQMAHEVDAACVVFKAGVVETCALWPWC